MEQFRGSMQFPRGPLPGSRFRTITPIRNLLRPALISRTRRCVWWLPRCPLVTECSERGRDFWRSPGGRRTAVEHRKFAQMRNSPLLTKHVGVEIEKKRRGHGEKSFFPNRSHRGGIR